MSLIFTDRQQEIAAREYCKIKGLDPDELVYHTTEGDIAGLEYEHLGARWQRIAKDLADFAIKHYCIDFAISSTVPSQPLDKL
jgi:hypothetical protein